MEKKNNDFISETFHFDKNHILDLFGYEKQLIYFKWGQDAVQCIMDFFIHIRGWKSQYNLQIK